MRLSPGDAVTVKDDWPETRGPAHVRTPHYLRGHKGRILRYLGRYPNPEDLAFARPAADRSLYHVAFPMNELWPDGGKHDEIVVEIYEHWLDQP
jgi:nitrile hydratase subunit beta